MSSFRKFLNRKNISVFVVFLILIIVGLFWWQIDNIDNFIESKKIERMVAPSKDYLIMENIDGKFVVNEKDGLKVKIPTGWEVDVDDNMEILESDREVVLYSKDFSYRTPKGCLIIIQINRVQQTPIEEYRGGSSFVIYPFESAGEIRETIDYFKEATLEERKSMQEKGIRIVSAGQKEALREVVLLGEDGGQCVTVKVPTENNVYIFRSTQFSEICDKKFNEFLETISIQ